MGRGVLSFLGLFVVFLFCVNVQALSISSPSVVIRCNISEKLFESDFSCLNEDCSINYTNASSWVEVRYPLESGYADKIRIRRNYFIFYYPLEKGPEMEDTFIDALALICSEDVEPARSFFKEKYAQWDKKSSISFAPYSEGIEKELIDKKTGDACYYSNYERYGDWLYMGPSEKKICPSDYPVLLMIAVFVAVLIIAYVYIRKGSGTRKWLESGFKAFMITEIALFLLIFIIAWITSYGMFIFLGAIFFSLLFSIAISVPVGFVYAFISYNKEHKESGVRKGFLGPTLQKIILAIVLYATLIFGSTGTVYPLISLIFAAINILPALVYFYLSLILLYSAVPFFVYLIATALWSYLLSCLIISFYNKFRKRKRPD